MFTYNMFQIAYNLNQEFEKNPNRASKNQGFRNVDKIPKISFLIYIIKASLSLLVCLQMPNFILLAIANYLGQFLNLKVNNKT